MSERVTIAIDSSVSVAIQENTFVSFLLFITRRERVRLAEQRIIERNQHQHGQPSLSFPLRHPVAMPAECTTPAISE